VDWDLLEALGGEDRRTVLARCRRRHFERGEVLFWEGDRGDGIHLVIQGALAVRVSTPLGDLGPGDTAGDQALLEQGFVRSATVVALEDTETLQLLRTDFAALLADHPDVRTMLVRLLDGRLRRTSQDLLEALYLSAEARVLRRLSRLGAIYAERGTGTIPITQEQLATMAGTTRPTVNRVLRRAQSEGLVKLERERITVTDQEALAQRASVT
jgi:CRP/FNR family transcriptional regulator, cyclic AMP receptor protein